MKNVDMKMAAYESLVARNGGRMAPADLLAEARNPASPFHECFEWDNDTCGEMYRLAQAAALIRRWKGSVIRVDAKAQTVRIESVRRVQSPAADRVKGGRSYQTVEQIMADPQSRARMVETVVRELAAYRKRYAEIVALSDVWAAIDEAIELHIPEKARRESEDVRPHA